LETPVIVIPLVVGFVKVQVASNETSDGATTVIV